MEPRAGAGAPQAPPTAPTATAPLLYWLLLVCGLAGLTVQRFLALEHFEAPRELVFLWVGTVGGAALGQLLARLRVRAWVLGALGAAGGWLSPILFFMLWEAIRGPAETCFYAFVPALACGYLSFSVRFGLAAFWYPAVLWMLVILDGPIPGALDARGAVPLGVGLAALFVAFLRASETRRVALWQAHASERLAAPRPRAVLRASPLRAASQIAWTGLVGATALVLTAWIAPHLWQREQQKHASLLAAQAVQRAAAERPKPPAWATELLPCCPENERREEPRDRVREYLPLLNGQDEYERRLAMSPPPAACTACRDGEPLDNASGNASSGWSYDAYGPYGSSEPPPVDLSTTPSTSSNGWESFAATQTPTLAPTPDSFAPTFAPPHVAPTAEATPPWALAPAPPAPSATPTTGAPVPGHHAPSAPPTATSAAIVPSQAPAAIAPKPAPGAAPAAVVVLVPTPAAPPIDAGAPWRSALAVGLCALALHVLVRAARRQLTLRHLARPFWNETLDQRISNHWQRVLIGLRDAGIHATHDEQPQALARRVGIEGLATCATILERVRHGVRVDADDLEVMHAAASDVYRAARDKAGVAARMAAWLRWPLA
jgi:hypothetical protein